MGGIVQVSRQISSRPVSPGVYSPFPQGARGHVVPLASGSDKSPAAFGTVVAVQLIRCEGAFPGELPFCASLSDEGPEPGAYVEGHKGRRRQHQTEHGDLGEEKLPEHG